METITRRLACFAVALCVMNAWLDNVRAQPWQLWRVNADGTGLVPIADLPGYSCHSPKWSPDGMQIAFDFRYPGEGLRASQIAVIRADGSNFRVLGPGGFAGWSPDGTHCVFHTYDAPQTVTVMKADGTGRESILPHRGGPRWLSDGNHMAVMGNGNITIFDLSSGRERSISNISSPYPGFGFSRDGLRVCFGRNTGGLYLATLDKQTMRAAVRTLKQAGMCYGASWSPDDKQIVLSWRPDAPGTTGEFSSKQQLFKLDADVDGPIVLFPGQDTNRSNKNPDWSHDGKAIVFSSQARD